MVLAGKLKVASVVQSSDCHEYVFLKTKKQVHCLTHSEITKKYEQILIKFQEMLISRHEIPQNRWCSRLRRNFDLWIYKNQHQSTFLGCSKTQSRQSLFLSTVIIVVVVVNNSASVVMFVVNY